MLIGPREAMPPPELPNAFPAPTPVPRELLDRELPWLGLWRPPPPRLLDIAFGILSVGGGQ